MFKKTIFIAAALSGALSLSACTTTQQGAAIGSAAGAVIGGASSGSVGGAVIGAAVGGVGGAVAGSLIGKYDKDPTQCVWEDRRGERYLAPCSPNG